MTKSRLLAFVIKELREVVPPTVFFAVGFNLIVLTTDLKQPLQIEALLAAVPRQTGLDHFGDETFREPLSRLLESCENEAHLNTMGRCALSQDILQLLINRLHIQLDREEWPWIAAEAITLPPLVGRWSRHLPDLMKSTPRFGSMNTRTRCGAI